MGEKGSEHIDLFSSAMTGILSLLKEITHQEDIPKSLSYLNLKIIIITLNKEVAYLFVKRHVKSLIPMTKHVLKDLKQDYSNLREIELKLIKDLSFAH